MLDNKVYIGQTVRPKERWSQHRAYAKLEKPIQYIHRAMARHGIDNFSYDVIASSWTQNGADEAEKLLIAQYDSRNSEKGYNIAPGGDPAWNRGLPKERQPMYGKKQSEFQKQRCAEIHTGLTFNHTEETKLKMSKTRTGMVKNDEWKKKIGEAHKGKKYTDETRQKMSAAHIGKEVSPETREKMSAAHTGKPKKPFTKEHRLNLSLANLGKSLTEEHKNKIANTLTGKLRVKLTAEQILEIQQSVLSSRKLANVYGVSANTIRNIKNRKVK